MNSRKTTNDPADRLALLTRAIQALHAASEPDGLLRLLVEFAVELAAADGGAIGLCEEGGVSFREIFSQRNWQPVQRRFVPGEGVAGRILEQRRPFACHDCHSDPLVAWQVKRMPGIKSLLAVPVQTGPEAKLLGCLELYSKSRKAGFGRQAIALLEALTSSAAAALEGLRRLRDHQDKQRNLEVRLERFMRSQAYANLGTWDWDIPNGALYWSDAIGPLFGYPAGALATSYENFLAAIHPDDRQRVVKAINTSVECGEPYEVEHRVVWPDGTVRWVLERGGVQRDDHGAPLRMLGVVQDVTRRREAETSLREQRDFAQAVIESAQSIVLVLDTRGRIVLFNPYLEEISGYSLEEVKGKDWFKIFLPLKRALQLTELFQHGMENILSRGKVGPIITKSGEFREIDWYYKSLKDQQDKLIGLLATGQDVTHRRKANQALRESEARFRGLVESTSDWIWEVDQQGRYTYVSPQVEEILGYSPDFLLGKSPFELMPAAERDRVQGEFFSLVKQRRPIRRLVNTNLHWSGREVVLETSGVPFYDNQGRLAGYRGIDRDITERLAAERALEEQTLRNRLILENSHDGLVILGLDGSIREVNDAYCRMVGYARASLLKMNAVDLNVFEQPGQVLKRLEKIRACGYDRFESRHRTRDGEAIDLDISATFAEIGEDRFIFSFIRDITERRLQERQRLREVQAQRDTLVREVHHRIKNHLQGVINLLRNHTRDKPELADLMESAIAQVESIALVHGLQSRLNQGRVALGMLLEVVCNALGQLTSIGMELAIDCPETDISISPDDTVPLALIINELFQNALKHGEPAGSSLTGIKARLWVEDERVHLQISNPGGRTLPANLDLGRGVGLGTGLTLVRDLLPHQGAKLSLAAEAGSVITRLVLEPPVVRLERQQAGQDLPPPNRLM